jgi:hypothetical protein
MRSGLWRKSTNDGEGNYKAASEQLLYLVMVFIESNKVFILYIYLSSTRQPKNKKSVAHRHKIQIEFYRP